MVKIVVLQIAALLVLGLLAIAPAFNINVTAQSITVQANPSVIPGSQAPLNGPRVSAIKYTIFASDSASLGSVLSGENQIMDYTPSVLSDVQTALSTKFLNTTSEAGSSFEYITFNEYSAKDPGFYLPFRQAIAHLINYTYIQNTVLSGIQGIATPADFLPSAFGAYVPTNYTIYANSLALANASLAQDPEIAYSSTDNKPTASNTIACDGSAGVWEYATSVGSGKPNGTAFVPDYITRPDHPTWFTFAQNLWKTAAKIGLCLNLHQVVGFGAVFPIVYAGYSDDWAMYDGGSSYSGTLDPIFNSYFPYTKAGIPGGPFANTEYFNNDTIYQDLHNAYYTTNVTYSEQQASLGIGLLQQQIPVINLWWDNWIIPSLNNFNGQYWAGYVDVPAFSTWQSAGAFYEGLSVHQVNPSTGATIVGGTFGVAQHEAPDGFNFLNDNSVYDAEIYNMLYDSGEIFSPGNPTLGGLFPWMFTGAPAYTSGVNMTTPHGYNMVNGMKVTLNFLNNITFVDNVPFTAADYNFSLWYPNLNGAVYNATTGTCSHPCWQIYANNTAARLTATQPDLIDSVVNSTNTVTVYMNGTGIEDYVGATTATVIPQHLWEHVNSTSLNTNDAGLSDASGKVNGISLMAGTGPFYFGSYVRGQYTYIYRNPGYFKTDIKDWAINGTGSQVPVSFNITQMGSPIPSAANVKAWILNNNAPVAGTTATLSLSGGSWTGNIPTGSLSPGFYEIVVNGTYSDSSGLAHTAVQFWGLNLGGTASGTSSTTVTTTTPTSATSQTTATSNTQSVTTSSPPTTATTSSSSPTVTTSSVVTSSSTTAAGSNLTLIAAAVVVVIIIIAGVAAYLVRRPKTTTTTTTGQ